MAEPLKTPTEEKINTNRTAMEGTNIPALYGSPTIPTKTDVGGRYPRGQRPPGSPPLTPGSRGGSASDIYNDPTPIKQTTIPKELPGFGTTDTSGMGGELNPEKKWIQTNEGGFVEQPALSQKSTVQAGEKPTGSPVKTGTDKKKVKTGTLPKDYAQYRAGDVRAVPLAGDASKAGEFMITNVGESRIGNQKFTDAQLAGKQKLTGKQGKELDWAKTQNQPSGKIRPTQAPTDATLPKDVADFNQSQLDQRERNPFGTLPEQLHGGRTMAGGTMYGPHGQFAQPSGTAEDRLAIKKEADANREGAFKVLDQYLSPAASRSMKTQYWQAHMNLMNEQASLAHQRAESDRQKEELARSRPDLQSLQEDQKYYESMAKAALDKDERAEWDRKRQETQQKIHEMSSGKKSDQTMPETQQNLDPNRIPRGTKPPGDDITVRWKKDPNTGAWNPFWAKPDPKNKGLYLEAVAKPRTAQEQTQPASKIVPTEKPQETAQTMNMTNTTV